MHIVRRARLMKRDSPFPLDVGKSLQQCKYSCFPNLISSTIFNPNFRIPQSLQRAHNHRHTVHRITLSTDTYSWNIWCLVGVSLLFFLPSFSPSRSPSLIPSLPRFLCNPIRYIVPYLRSISVFQHNVFTTGWKQPNHLLVRNQLMHSVRWGPLNLHTNRLKKDHHKWLPIVA